MGEGEPKKEFKKTVQDQNKELRDTEQEVMIELKIKTNEFLEKLKEANKKNRVQA